MMNTPYSEFRWCSCAQVAAEDSLLTPRFYTTDFDEMDQLFNLDLNKNLPMEEFEAMLSEFKTDYNQKVRSSLCGVARQRHARTQQQKAQAAPCTMHSPA